MMMTPLKQTAELHKALGHPIRLRILDMLRGGELCVCQMTSVLSLAISTVSAHLSELSRVELLTERKEGRWVFYRLSDAEPSRAVFESLWPLLHRDPQLTRDKLIVKRLRRLTPEKVCAVELDLGKLGISMAPKRKK